MMGERSPELRQARVAITPLIDVSFLLLVFFLVGFEARADQELSVYLPKRPSFGCCRLLSYRRVVLRSLPERGPDAVRLRLGDRRWTLPAEAEDHPAWGELREELRAWRRSDRLRGLEDPELVIDAEDSVPYRHFARALNETVAAGVRVLTITTPRRSQNRESVTHEQ